MESNDEGQDGPKECRSEHRAFGSWSEGETFGGSEPKRGREIATLDR